VRIIAYREDGVRELGCWSRDLWVFSWCRASAARDHCVRDCAVGTRTQRQPSPQNTAAIEREQSRHHTAPQRAPSPTYVSTTE